jgi:hypothetical protein
VNHLDSGELRRILDEPEDCSAQVRLHAQTCEQCRARASLIAADAEHAARTLGGRTTADPSRAYLRIRDRLAPEPSSAGWHRALAAGALAAAFIAALLFTPLGGLARSFLTVFEPRQFEPIEVSRTDLRNLHLLPQADDVGTQRTVLKPKRQVAQSLAVAQQRTGFAVLRPTVLPPGFGSIHSYRTISPGELTFTFSAAKARAFERRSGKALPPMPPSLDGTSVRLRTGYVFNAHYESVSAAQSNRRREQRTDFFELVEAQIPRVTSTGASLDTLEHYLLSMPNVSPQLAAQIRALGDIQNTVPVPVIIDKQTARRISVGASRGLAIGDNTGLGAGVMWEKNGMIYVVAGPLSMDKVMAIANGLR